MKMFKDVIVVGTIERPGVGRSWGGGGNLAPKTPWYQPTDCIRHSETTIIHMSDCWFAAVLRYERTEYGKEVRKMYENGKEYHRRSEMRIFQPRLDGQSNTLTSVLKDNYVLLWRKL